jgi:glutaconate CoA-transferase subunit A
MPTGSGKPRSAIASDPDTGTPGGSKLCSLADAVRAYVRDGSSVYITGFSHLIGFAAGHELIRAGLRGLILIRMTPDLVYDQLVAAGCAEHLVFSYVGNPGVGALPVTRRAIEQNRIGWTEYTHGTLIAALRAAASGAPFAVATALLNTDLATANPLVGFVQSPYDGTDVPVVPPLACDVAFAHVQQADVRGNSIVWGAVGEIREAAFAAKAVVVTAEEIVDEAVIRANPDRVVLPEFVVSAVAHVPWAAHPANAQGYYARDNRFYRSWQEVAATDASVQAFIEADVLGIPDRAAYAARHEKRLTELAQIGELLSTPVNYGDGRQMKLVQD